MLEIKPIFNALLRSKAGAVMLLLQIAITTAIVSNAAFIIYDRVQYLQQETGYPEDEIFSFSVLTFGTDIDLSQKFEENEEMLRNLPGVMSAGLISEVPVSGSGSASTFGVSPASEEGLRVRAAYTQGDEHTLNTLGLSLSAGRNFRVDEVIVTNERTAAMPQVIIVSKTFLDEMFPGGDGLGNTIYFGDFPLQIIGVVDKMMGPWLKDRRPDNLLIMPYVQANTMQKIVVRAQANERAAIMREIEDIMLNDYNKRVIVNVNGMDERKAEYNASDLLMLRMLLVLIVVLVLVTGLGIFGLTTFNINKRTKQIGTRRALGARKSDIVRFFLVENSIICLLGITIGSAAALFLGKFLLEQYSLPALDILYILATAMFILAVSLLSVVFPASKAANISPSVATRSI